MNHLPPAVATMSLTVPVGLWSRVLDTAVSNLIEQAKVWSLIIYDIVDIRAVCSLMQLSI